METSQVDSPSSGRVKKPAMNTREMQEFLFRFYKKRVASFLANLYKSSITGAMKDIHRTRLDVKKIYALFTLYEMADPKMFSRQENYILFNRLFKRSGKIRETQINLMLLEGYHLDKSEAEPFRLFLEEQEKLFTTRLLEALPGFDEKKLAKTGKEIGKLCRKMSKKKLVQKGDDFIEKKAKNIEQLLDDVKNIKNVHGIRQELKAMSTIANLLHTVKPGDYLEQIIGYFNKTEMLIGEWHDRVVFLDNLNLFLVKKPELPQKQKNTLDLLVEEVNEELKNYLDRFLPEVDLLVRFILETGHDAKGRIVPKPQF